MNPIKRSRQEVSDLLGKLLEGDADIANGKQTQEASMVRRISNADWQAQRASVTRRIPR